MKKILLLVLVFAVVVICPSIIFAGGLTLSLSSATFTASLTPAGGVQQYDASLRNRTGNTIAASMTWTGVAAGNPGYKVGNQYIMVNSTITNMVGWRMNIYTDNLVVCGGFHPYHSVNNVAFASQAAAVSTASVRSYGLVGQDNSTSADENVNGTCYGLPLAWMVSDTIVASPVTPVFSLSRVDGTQGFTDYMWKFVQDKGRKNVNGTSAWLPTSTYVRVWDQAGYYWNEDPTKASLSSDGKIFIYLAVDSTSAKAQTYTTKSLTIDAIQL